jgi:thiosulfate dehydrogenase (quinone) large subunit
MAIRVLRAFLGVTFVYAGLNKLADPNFLHAGSFDYIGMQLQRFAEGSPIGPFIRLAAHAPVLTGVLIALVEIAVGAGTLLGIAPIAAASIGLAINVVLFLSATWHVHPYFLGSDSVYAVAWAAYLVALVETRRRAAPGPVVGHRRRSVRQAAIDARRREVIRGLLLGGATLVLAGLARAVAGPATTATRRAAGGASARGSGAPGSSTGAAGSPSSPSGTRVASLAAIPVGGVIGFNAPGVGPAVLLRPAQDRVEAYSRICTHAGCLVGYNPQARLLVCPCHGAEFDPSRGARPVAGPAFVPLRPIPVSIDQATRSVVMQG